MRGQAVSQSGRSIRRWGWARAALVVCASALLFSACGDDSSTPTAPSPTPAPTTPAPTPPDPTPPATSTTFTVSGTVTDTHTGDAIVGATVTVLDGAHEGRLSTTNDLGAFAIMELEGNLNVAVRAEGYLERRFSVHGVATTLDVDLAPGPSAPEPGPAPEPDDDAPKDDAPKDDAPGDDAPDDDAPDAAPAPPAPVPPVNTPATGMPTITGTAQVGEMLMANTSAIMDADGLSAPATFMYQWMSNGAPIAEAMAATYEVQATDAGNTIMVRVTFTDDAGNTEVLTSAATVMVPVEDVINTPATGVPTISGTAQVGQTLTAITTGIDDADGLPATFTYQWMSNGTAIPGAMAATYEVQATDAGKTIMVQVTFTDDAGNTEVLTSAATVTVAVGSGNTPVTGVPTISGTAQVGQTLTAITTGIDDADGLPATFTYQWLADGVAIMTIMNAEMVLAMGSTYVVTSGDNGKAITVRVTFTDDAGYTEVLTSAPRTVSANNPATGVPTISGFTGGESKDIPRVGDKLAVTAAPIMDLDGLPATFTYEWRTNPTTSNLEVSTTSKYTVQPVDAGKVIVVAVSFTDGKGYEEEQTSEATPRVLALFNSKADFTPMITGADVEGMARVDMVLTAVPGEIMDADELPAMPVYTYQWMTTGTGPGDKAMPISGANGKTYKVKAGEVGKAGTDTVVGDVISVVVGFTDSRGNMEMATSDDTSAVTYVNTPATEMPTITGMPKVDQTLTADTSAIKDADGLGPFTYVWHGR